MEIKKAAITHANFFCKAKDVTHNCNFFLEFASIWSVNLVELVNKSNWAISIQLKSKSRMVAH